MRPFSAAFLAVACLFVSASAALSAESLYSDFSRKGTIKVFVMDPSDTSSNKKIDPAVLKKTIEEALTGRKSLKFELAPTREAADIAVETQVTEYYWTDHDPVDMIIGVGGTAADALQDDHYARTQAVLKVTDTKTGRALWSDSLLATVTEHDMKQEDGPKRAGEKLAQEFVARAFGKKKGR